MAEWSIAFPPWRDKSDALTMYFVYVIQSQSTKRFYIGSTPTLDKRATEHNNGWTKSTRNKGSWIIVYTEKVEIKTEALKREKQIKRYKGGNAFKSLLTLGWRSGQSHQTVNLTP